MVRLYLGVGILFVALALACGGGEEAQPTPTPTAEVQAPTPESTATAAPTATREPAVQTLAFIQDGDLWLVNADGTERRRITDFGGTDREVVDFQWLANGREIAYHGGEIAYSALVSLDGQVLWELDGDPTTFWSPDGQLVAILPYKGPPARIEDRDGRPVWRSGTFETLPRQGSWSADGSHFAIVEGSEIVVVSRDGTSVRRLYAGPTEEDRFKSPSGCTLEDARNDELLFGRPVFSPDGQSVLVAVNCSFNTGTGGIFGTIIYEASLDGLVNRPVPGSEVTSLPTPVFSPDGGRIALLRGIRGEYCPDGASAFGVMGLTLLNPDDGTTSGLRPREIAQLVGDLATEGRAADIQISARFRESPVVWSRASNAIVASFSATECVCVSLEECPALEQCLAEAEYLVECAAEQLQSHRLLAGGVYLLRADGVADEKIADGFSETASWSPSGNLITYVSGRDVIEYIFGEPGTPQIRVFDLLTGDVTDLGPGHSPAWQPLPSEAVSLPWEGEVTDDLRIRSEANTASDIVGTLPKGTKVRVYGEVQGEEAEAGSDNRTWYRVIGGWVYSASVER